MDEIGGPGPYIAVVGPADVGEREYQLACGVGRLLALRGAVVVTGGLGGVMRAACEGAALVDGTTIGVLPGTDRRTANEFVRIPIATGQGQGRNLLLVTTADVVIAIGRSPGTLSEIALAARQGKPVVLLASYDQPEELLPGALTAATPMEAANLAFSCLAVVNPAR
jgi:uncharacterized protein (TIGR00725 family)